METFLAQKRREKHLTPAQLAQAVGAAEEEVARWEAGELPDSRYLLPLAEVLGVEVEEILRAATEKPHGASSVTENAGASPSSAAPLGEYSGKVPAEEETSAAAVAEAEQHAVSPQQLHADGTPDGLSSMQPPDGERADRPKGSVSAEPEGWRQDEWPVKEKLSTPVNGFTHGERVFGYIVCLLVVAAAVFVFVLRFTVWTGRALNQDNYARYLDFDVEGWSNVTISVTSSADIEDFSAVLEVEFYSWASFDDRVERTMTLSDNFLAEGETVSGSVSEGGTYQFYRYRVISVGGKIV